ncbi:MAG: hypothetical protein WA324_04700 [Bryobacteraceae bacterium]
MPEVLPLEPPEVPPALKHGCRSSQLLLRHEDPQEWMRMLERYVEEYQPQSAFVEDLVLEAAQAHWFFKRTQTNFHQTQMQLPQDPTTWTAENHHQIALFLRYQTTAERSHQRALAKLQSYQRMQWQHEQRRPRKQEPAREQGAQAMRQQGALPATPAAAVKEAAKPVAVKPVFVEQWVEIRNVKNQVVADFTPSNDELAAEIEQKKVRPTLLYRRLNFPDGVPSKYQWTRPRSGMATRGGMAAQRMTIETWEKLREIERESGLPERTGLVTLRDWRDG